MYIGIGITAVGLLFIVFGPDRIIYNTREGITFIKVLQLYPGPITSLGFLIACVAHYLYDLNENKRINIIKDKLDERIDTLNEIPEGYKPLVKNLGSGDYRIEFVTEEEFVE